MRKILKKGCRSYRLAVVCFERDVFEEQKRQKQEAAQREIMVASGAIAPDDQRSMKEINGPCVHGPTGHCQHARISRAHLERCCKFSHNFDPVQVECGRIREGDAEKQKCANGPHCLYWHPWNAVPGVPS